MTKADKIRMLSGLGWAVNDIARETDCLPAYVRVCVRQRVDGRQSAHDRTAGHRRMARYHADPVYRAHLLARKKRWRAANKHRRGSRAQEARP